MNDAVNKAAAKGARQSLLVMENQAFIVSVPNRDGHYCAGQQ